MPKSFVKVLIKINLRWWWNIFWFIANYDNFGMSFSFSKLKAWEGNSTYWVTAKIRPREIIKCLYPRKYIHAKYGKVYFHENKFKQKSISRILISAKINFLKVEHLRTAVSEMQVLSQRLQRHINLLKFKMKISAHEVVLVVLLNLNSLLMYLFTLN